MAHAQQIIRDLLQKIAAEQDYTNYDLTVTPISTGGANYTSHLYIATISEGNNELNIFAKVAAVGEKLRSQFPMQLYDIERFFYTKLAKTFQLLEEKAQVPKEHRLKVPVFYGCNEKLYEETIVLENLTAKGFVAYDRFKPVTWEYAASAITELAKFHALSAAYQHEYPEEFEKVLAEVKFDMGDDEQMKVVWGSIVTRAVDATREENKEKLKKFFGSEFVGTEAFIKFLGARKLNVIGHGDYRPSNLMHKEREDGRVEVIPVDFQTLRGGCPVVDLLYFIFTGTDHQFRALYYERLLEHYYSELRAALARLGLDPDHLYSREDFEAELKEKLPFGLCVAVFTLPIVTVEAEHAPKVNEDMDLADFSIENTGSLYPARLNGVVDDFVRWGVI